jgi:SpoVK/Ycf46/Vps4 family AAA+-type ATPase
MKNFLRVLSIALLVSNSVVPMQLFGRGHGKKKETESSPVNQNSSAHLNKGKEKDDGRPRSHSNTSNENFASKIEQEQPSIRPEKMETPQELLEARKEAAEYKRRNEPSSSYQNQKTDYEMMEEASQAGIKFAENNSELPDELVKSLLNGCPQKLKKIIGTFERKESAGDGLPKLIILLGEPGVGKSKLSKAIAQHLKFGIKFINAAQLGNEFRKSSEKDFARIFASLISELHNAKKPMFVVFDELQTLTAGHQDTGHSSEANVAVAFWQLVDKCADEENIYIIGTLNNEKDLPAALIRRAQKVTIPRPDAQARKTILTYHLSHLNNSGTNSATGTIIDTSCNEGQATNSDIITTIARKADKFTGSDLCEVVKQAIGNATYREKLEKNNLQEDLGKKHTAQQHNFETTNNKKERYETAEYQTGWKKLLEDQNLERQRWEKILRDKEQYVVVIKKDLEDAFKEQSDKVYSRTYPQGRFPNLTWENAEKVLQTLDLLMRIGKTANDFNEQRLEGSRYKAQEIKNANTNLRQAMDKMQREYPSHQIVGKMNPDGTLSVSTNGSLYKW